jgi:hypothetical protein
LDEKKEFNTKRGFDGPGGACVTQPAREGACPFGNAQVEEMTYRKWPFIICGAATDRGCSELEAFLLASCLWTCFSRVEMLIRLIVGSVWQIIKLGQT